GPLRGKQATIGGGAANLDAQDGDHVRAFFIEDFLGTNGAIVNAGDLHLFSAKGQQGGVNVVEALAEAEAPADALVVIVFADAVAQIEFAGEAVRLIENPRLGEADAGVGLLRARLQRDAESLSRADKGIAAEDVLETAGNV